MKDFYTTIQEWAPIEEMTAPASTKEKQEAAVDAVSKKKEVQGPEPIYTQDIKNLITRFSKAVNEKESLKAVIYKSQEDISKLTMAKKAKLLQELLGM
jgi:hypothetical protein